MKQRKKSVKAIVPEVVGSVTYDGLLAAIGNLLHEARASIARHVNDVLVRTYWQTGRYIVEYEQHGSDRAKYGDGLINRLVHDLTAREGRGYSKTNILYMRKLYLTFRKGETLSHFLSWSHYLVFFNYRLNCFVLIDLKRSDVEHYDIGQMNMYLNYFKEEVNELGHGEPIGIVLGADKDDVMVHYATSGITNKLFVSRYKLYLPDKEQLRRELARAIEEESRRANPPRPITRKTKKPKPSKRR